MVTTAIRKQDFMSYPLEMLLCECEISKHNSFTREAYGRVVSAIVHLAAVAKLSSVGWPEGD